MALNWCSHRGWNLSPCWDVTSTAWEVIFCFQRRESNSSPAQSYVDGDTSENCKRNLVLHQFLQLMFILGKFVRLTTSYWTKSCISCVRRISTIHLVVHPETPCPVPSGAVQTLFKSVSRLEVCRNCPWCAGLRLLGSFYTGNSEDNHSSTLNHKWMIPWCLVDPAAHKNKSDPQEPHAHVQPLLAVGVVKRSLDRGTTTYSWCNTMKLSETSLFTVMNMLITVKRKL